MQTALTWIAAASVVAVMMRKNFGSQKKRPPKPGDSKQRFRSSQTRIYTHSTAKWDDAEEHPHAWGFADTEFVAHSDDTVTLLGNRYALCQHKLPYLLPWVRKTMQIDISVSDIQPFETYQHAIEPVNNQPFMQELASILKPEQIDQTLQTRVRHNHGHTQEEIYDINYGGQIGRIPDVVVYPDHERQVLSLVEAAGRHHVCLIPFGGGTNVTLALQCPQQESRLIVSVDMRRMNRIVWIDADNHMACIEAGATGRHIVKSLQERGFTMGHEPDSIEFSTLGGWIATHASGMKKNRYGNIEDLLIDLHVVTAQGLMSRSNLAPRESVGLDTRRWLLGSEGQLGIVTSAVVKLFPLPQVARYGSIVFPSFEHGVEFLYELNQTTDVPASVRLVDNTQFQFSLALKPAKGLAQSFASHLEKFYVTKLRKFHPDSMAACTLVFEGSAQEVAGQERTVYRLAQKHGGLKAGAKNGERGYQLTYGIAYIRDFVMKHHIIAESFETSVPWSRVLELCDRVKERIYQEHAKRRLPGKPFVTCRVTQLYSTGVCVYFYFGFYAKGVQNPSHVYKEIEEAARDEILQAGGSLSHHHGIGKLRQRFLDNIMSKTALTWRKSVKQAVDPQNIFGCGNQIPHQ